MRALALFFSLLAATAAAAATAATERRPWTSDDILAMKAVSDPQISPEGRWVAYVVESLNDEKDAYQTDIWLAPAAGGDARQLSSAPQNDDAPRWSPDGKWIAFLSERPRPGAKRDDADEAKRQVWLIRPDGGEARPLTSAPGRVSALAWSRDGKTIGFLAREPKSEERRRREKEKDDAWTPSDMYPWNRLWVIDVSSREARQLTKGALHVGGFAFSPDGQRVAFSGQPTPLIPDSYNADLYLVPVAKAAIVGAAVTDLASFTGTTDIPDFSRSYFASWPWEDPQAYVEHSAVFHAGKVKTPSLVVHGDKDDRVPPSQGWELYTALEKVGVPTDLLVLPRQPHGPREPKLLRTCHEWFVRWIETYVRAK